MKTKTYFVILTLILAMFLSGCSSNETVSSEKNEESSNLLTVYTTIFPLEDFTKKIGGDFVEVKNVYPPNVDAHDYEPTLKAMTNIARADLLIYTGVGLEGFIDKAKDTLKNERVVMVNAGEGINLLGESESHQAEEVHSKEEHAAEGEEAHSEEEHAAEGEEVHSEEEHAAEGEEAHADEHNHGDVDPHVWLDPILSIELANNIKEALIEQLPDQKEQFEQNFEQLKSELEQLDQEFKQTVESSQTKYLLVSHAAYGYWEKRYGIEQIAIAGLSPTQEPSQRQLETIIEESKEHNVRYIVFEQNVSSRVAELIQKEIGAESLTLHNLETATEEDIKNNEDYFSIMKRNLETIKTALNN